MTRAEALATYEALLTAQDPQRSTVPLPTVSDYIGEADAEQRPHGQGGLDSSMGYSYAGSFVHGQVEGQGVMTWADGHVYEGAFKDGVMNGTGKITWAGGTEYIGDIVNGVRHGGGTLTSHSGRATYNGNWSRGKRFGWGRQCYPDGSVYEGEWKDNERNGRGMLTYASGDCYDGEWVAGARHGLGVMGWKQGGPRYVELYDGAWVENVPHGEGQSTYIVYPKEAGSDAALADEGHRSSPAHFAAPGDAIVNVYQGSYVDGKRAGWGTFFYADGSCYKGAWAGGRKNGKGTFMSAVGTAYDGTFVDDKPTDLPSLAVVGSGPAVVPTVNTGDLCGIADESVEEMTKKITALLLRFNTPLKALFGAYAVKNSEVAFICTSPDWWRHRVPGRISIPQLLRLLSDAGLVDGLVTISTVLHCIEQTLRVEAGDASHSLCTAAGVQESDGEDAVGDTDPDSGEKAPGLKIAPLSPVYRVDGWLNYRQFSETLVRVASVVGVGVGYGGVSDKFNKFVENNLKVTLGCLPLCPLTREHETELRMVLPQLEALYCQLAELERGDGTNEGKAFVRVRTLLQFMRPLLTEYGLTLQDAVRIMVPFQRVSSAHLPPGFNRVENENQMSLAQELYTAGCGKESKHTPSYLVSGVMVEQELSLVDFVESLVALALAAHEVCCPGALQNFIVNKVLPLPL